MLPQATRSHFPLDTSPVISTPEFSCVATPWRAPDATRGSGRRHVSCNDPLGGTEVILGVRLLR
jgi:hypothetical protein